MTSKRITRHDARILALSALFCWEVGKLDPEDALAYLLHELSSEGAEPRSLAANADYAERLVREAVRNVTAIDQAIEQVSEGWPLSRMPRVDLSIMRLAVAEGAYVKGAPIEVVLDEAVELAKEFSSHASPRFINGLLVAIFGKMGCAGIREKG